MLSGKHEYTFLISLNEDDKTMNNGEMRKFLQEAPNDCNIRFYYADHKDKIAACNADIKYFNFDILFLISDDMIPQVQDFDEIIVDDMNTHFKDRPGALHYPDGFNNNSSKSVITLTIMNKALYDYFGYVYHPDYKSFFCDAEFTRKVYRIGACVYHNKVIVKHEWSGGPKSEDALYRHNSKLGIQDKHTYAKRKELGFPKECVL